MLNTNTINEFQKTTASLISQGFRFSIIHNPDEKTITVISVTKPDQIKNKFPDFNIFLNNHQQKCVERVYNYSR